MQQSEVHISSLIVHARPDDLDALTREIDQIPGAEVYGVNPDGKIVVVLETEHQNYITDTIEKINGIEAVLNTALVYHQIEDTASIS